ncbi:hypothetical protein SUGI_0714960 [Cryptomeria japonica]|nr:hypothetical protein SUGI_0714960 [Cryptomeria japonica]
MNSLAFVGKFPVDNEEHVTPERSSHSRQGSGDGEGGTVGNIGGGRHGDYLQAEDDIDDLQIIRVVCIQMELRGKSRSHENVIEVWVGATRHDSPIGGDHEISGFGGGIAIVREATTDEDFHLGKAIGGRKWQHDERTHGRVVLWAVARHSGECFQHHVVLVVEENRVPVGKDKDIAIEGQMEEGIEDVLDYGVGSGLAKKGRVVCSLTRPLNMPVPPTKMMRLLGRIWLEAYQRLARNKVADIFGFVPPPACLNEGLVGEKGTGGALGVGEDHERPDGVGGYVVFDGVSSAVMGQGLVLWVVMIAPIIQEELRWPKVHPNGFFVHGGHVHGRDTTFLY